ncbi:putative ion transporter superfamily protein YfcC [Entomoplasma freundtii]|uniref:Arginine/ornithine antiporter n=1 Tax=Entomoplasma freundtii TaxID=74700 RepID=A0A2K8NQJ7_9MOLU|nr:YfcC family protein [Entomoplasma freundtii]ATZ16099.1 arginine/ornithine antiporter [Entomoplasma freundtii]TDY57000.1 putative ion transporter superfamily protein YfcC [Entomoplasma freundtii]
MTASSIFPKNAILKEPRAFKTRKNRKNKERKPWHVLSAFSILLILIAILVITSWILNWANVHTNITTTTIDALGIYLKQNGTEVHILPGDSLFKEIFGDASLTNNQQQLNDLLHKWLGANRDYEFDRWDLRILSETTSVKIKALGVIDIFFAPIKGFVKQANIIIFVLIVGGFLFLVVQSKSLEGFSQGLIHKLKGKELWAIPPIMLFFSLCGTVEGLAEEALAFYAFSIPLMLIAGFDTMTGFLIVFLGAGIGVVGSTVVPFSIVPAINALNGASVDQGGPSNFITIGDGLVWRFITWFVVTSSAIGFVTWYAWRVKRHPDLSVTFKTATQDKKFFLANSYEKIKMDWRRKTTLAIFFLAYLIMLLYLINWDTLTGTNIMAKAGEKMNEKVPWLTAWIPGFGQGSLLEVSCFFLIGSIILGLINGLGEDKFIKEFMTGASDLLSVSLVIATASGIALVLEATYMQNLVLVGLENSIGSLNSNIGKLIILFLLFIPISIFIPSTSGFAVAIFPLLLNVVAVKDGNGEIIGAHDVLASGSVEAFVNANGFVNLWSPTSSLVLAGLAIARINYITYLKLMWKYFLALFALLILMLTFGGLIGGNIA